MTNEINSNFRLILDFQGFTQNEIPDSLLFEESITMYLDESNLDAMPSFADIWHKILDDNYLNILTDQEGGQEPIRKIDIDSHNDFTNQDGLRAKNMKQIYEKSANNATLTAQFHQFLGTQKESFDEQLKAQQS